MLADNASPKATFPKERRIRSKADFERLRECRKKVSTKHFVFILGSNDFGFARLGVIASKKTFPTAVARNRVKRLCRDVFRRTGGPSGLDLLVIAKSGADDLQSNDVAKEWSRARPSIEQQLHSTNSPL